MARSARAQSALKKIGALRVVFTSKLHSYMTSRPCTYIQYGTALNSRATLYVAERRASRGARARAATSHVRTRVCDACCHSGTILLPLKKAFTHNDNHHIERASYGDWTRGDAQGERRQDTHPSRVVRVRSLYTVGQTAELRDRQLVDLYECECALRAFWALRAGVPYRCWALRVSGICLWI